MLFANATKCKIEIIIHIQQRIGFKCTIAIFLQWNNELFLFSIVLSELVLSSAPRTSGIVLVISLIREEKVRTSVLSRATAVEKKCNHVSRVNARTATATPHCHESANSPSTRESVIRLSFDLVPDPSPPHSTLSILVSDKFRKQGEQAADGEVTSGIKEVRLKIPRTFLSFG